MSESPSSVQWQNKAMLHHKNTANSHNDWRYLNEDEDRKNADGNEHVLSEAWKIPEQSEMQRRLEYRKGIREETLQHRRIHRHGGIGGGGRNIVYVLQDRQTKGPHIYGHTRNYQLPKSATTATAATTSGEGPVPPPPPATPTAAATPKSTGHHSNTTTSTTKKGTSTTPTTANKYARIPFVGSVSNEIRTFAEYCSVTRYHSAFFPHLGGNDPLDAAGRRPSSSEAVSTISVAFSPDAQTMASTHGDHTVKITCTKSGQLLQTLEGHPRTPWTVKYHPHSTSSSSSSQQQIVASGCLGHQVRLWDWPKGHCLHMIRLEFAIISLSFHPQGQVLAIANGTRLHFWALDGLITTTSTSAERETQETEQDEGDGEVAETMQVDAGSISAAATTAATDRPQASTTSQQPLQAPPAVVQAQQAVPPQNPHRRGILTEVEQRHMLRCVHFPPDGKSLIVGGVNPTQSNVPSRRGISGMSFYLRLFDFDLQLALEPNAAGSGASTLGGYRRRVISNPRTFVPRALLYNDGGFDVSPDGKTLCACAEYWLPDGVENAMDLLYPYTDEDDDDDDTDTGDMDNQGQNAAADDELDTASRSATTPTAAMMESADSGPDGIPPAAATTPNTATNWASPPRSGTVPTTDLQVPATTTTNMTHHPLGASLSGASSSAAGGRTTFPLTPETPPPSAIASNFTLSPPSPPGRRFAGGLSRVPMAEQQHQQQPQQHDQGGTSSSSNGRPSSQRQQQRQPQNNSVSTPTNRTSLGPPPPPPPGMQRGMSQDSAFTIMTRTLEGGQSGNGRFVPHVVTISLDTTPVDSDALSSAASSPPTTCSGTTRPRLGQLLEACPLDGAKASAVTCVKFSPSTNFCLIGYGVREPLVEHNGTQYHPVTALYRVRGGMTHVSTMLSGDDDVNIARFHPDSGYGFVYGTKQGRVRVLSPRPWNFYNC